jgi:hypothetical protein
MRLSKTDQRVIDAFLDEKAAESSKLSSDGKRLDGNWMGGRGIAEWKLGAIDFTDLGSRAAQTVQKAIIRKAPAKWFSHATRSGWGIKVPLHRNPDFDEEGVESEMALALIKDGDIDDPEDLEGEVKESHLSSFGVEAFSVGPLSGYSLEYTVVEDEDAAEELALAVVTQDLEEEPEIFTPSFIESHIDQDKLKEYVREAAYDYDYANELAQEPEDFWQTAEQYDLEVPEPEEDEDGDEVWPGPSDEDIDELATAIAEDRAEDPMGWMEDLYGDEARKQAIDAVGIDIEAAAKEAVQVDGWAHFLARYDGNYSETPGGFIYWRDS